MQTFLKGDDGHWSLTDDVTAVLDHSGEMVEVLDGLDNAIEQIESMEGQSAIRHNKDDKPVNSWNVWDRAVTKLVFHDPTVFDDLHGRNEHRRKPKAEIFDQGKEILVRNRKDFVSIRHNGTKFLICKEAVFEDLVGYETPAGEVKCKNDPALAAVLHEKRNITRDKVRKKLCKPPKPKKIDVVKEWRLRDLMWDLRRVCYNNGIPMDDCRKYTLGGLAVSIVMLDTLDEGRVTNDRIRKIAMMWNARRDENIKRYGGWDNNPALQFVVSRFDQFCRAEIFESR